MDHPNIQADQRSRLADRLLLAGQRRFVGREAELDLVRTALEESPPPFAVLFVYGPGGVGKTSLLGAFAHVAQQAGRTPLRLDARNIDPSPPAFLQALGETLGSEQGSPLDPSAWPPGVVLMIDTYETVAGLDTWLREAFLPTLPENSVVVIAGRNPPDTAWRTAPGWSALVRVLPLRNLRPEESSAYLDKRGVPVVHHAAMLEWTHGHPLALSLLADVITQREISLPLRLEQTPDVVRVLLERFLEQVPSRVHRQALEVCARVRATTEDLLAIGLETDNAGELFAWLRSLSFVEQGVDGLFPHDLVREVLDADLRWRNPERFRELHRRLRAHYLRRIRETSGREQQRAFFDHLYLGRHHPLLRPYHDYRSLGSAYAGPATARDASTIAEMVRKHEGDASARLAAYWLKRQPQSFAMFRDLAGDAIGFIANLALHETTAEDCATDPAVDAAWRFARRYGQLRPGEEMVHTRFWMGRDTYQVASTAQTLMAMTNYTCWMTRSRLAWSFMTCADPDYWRPTFTYLNLRRSLEAEYTIVGRHTAVFTHDWRAEPADAWLDLQLERGLATDITVEMMEAAQPPLVVLSQPAFVDAVRKALREYARPDALATNPLIRSRVVAEHAVHEPTPETIQALLRTAADALRSVPKDEKLYRALWHTYFRPAATQELAAEMLGLPFSTYRYHLASGIERIAEWLWERELYGSAG